MNSFDVFVIKGFTAVNYNTNKMFHVSRRTILSSQNLCIKISESRHRDSRDPQIDTPIKDSKRYSLIL